MNRAILAVAGTALGTAAVVSYHATSANSTGISQATAAAATQPTASRTTQPHTPHRHTRTSAVKPTAASSVGAPKSAVGQAVNFGYGYLKVKVTERAGKIADVSVVNARFAEAQSQSITAYAVPQLRSEVIAAQSVHINGVSGASYTSAAYERSVQSALDKL